MYENPTTQMRVPESRSVSLIMSRVAHLNRIPIGSSLLCLDFIYDYTDALILIVS